MWPIVRRSSQKTRIGLLVELRKVVDQASIGKAASKQVLTISNLAPPSVQARNGEFKSGSGILLHRVLLSGRSNRLFVANRTIM